MKAIRSMWEHLKAKKIVVGRPKILYIKFLGQQSNEPSKRILIITSQNYIINIKQ